MIISVNWLKKFTNIDVPIEDLTALIGARLVEIEDVTDLGAKYKDVVVARVVECRPIENSDHLNVTKLDDGGVVGDVARDEHGLVQVVCGAPNVRTGLLVAWLPPRSTVPETYGDAESFVLEPRMLRGVMSNGMIASAKELDLFDDHTGILELDKDLEPGSSFAKGYELDDYLLNIENKSLTHRPDTFGIIGFAREVAAIQGKRFETPVWLKDLTSGDYEQSSIDAPTVTIDDPELSHRYQAVVLADADGGARSPLQLQTYLSRVGVRPISAVVDVTNYLMVLTGQPLHAFDYDKLVANGAGRAEIHVRAGQDGEILKLLDGRDVELSPDDIVIAAGETPVGLAGAMGGADTEIDETTKNIIVESATFNLYNLRATQMRHGIFSEAITRFTKGQPAELTAPVLTQAVKMMKELANARPVTPVVEAYPGRREPENIDVSIDMVNAVLGSKLVTSEVLELLENVEIGAVSDDGVSLRVTPPYWRADIHIPEDVIEEVGRLNGFDTIEPRLPRRDFTAVLPNEFDGLRAKIRHTLVRGGANEVLTYSFVHGDILKRAGQKLEDSYRLTNSISPELQYYRQSLTPSLLSLIHPNTKGGYDSFALFEMNKAHNKIHGLDDEGIPGELNFLALTLARQKASDGTAYYHAKQYLDYLGDLLGLTFRYDAIQNDPGYSVTAPFEYRRSSLVTETNSGEFIGIVGEYKRSVIRNFKLPTYVAGFEVGSEALLKAVQAKGADYTPLSRYPSAERDVCFQVKYEVMYAQVEAAAKAALEALSYECSIIPLDIYQAEASETKNITLRFRLTSFEKTLTGSEIANVMDEVIRTVATATSATVI